MAIRPPRSLRPIRSTPAIPIPGLHRMPAVSVTSSSTIAPVRSARKCPGARTNVRSRGSVAGGGAPLAGSAPWNACKAALNKRINGIMETMRPICERAENVQEAKNRCITTYYTADGKAYQLTGIAAAFHDNAKNEQLCMKEVERCFNRNRNRDAQNACVNGVVACFNPDTGPRSRAAVRLFGASAGSAGRGSASVGMKLVCMSMTRDPSVFVVGRNSPFVFIPGPKGTAVGDPYVDLASSVVRCSPRSVFALPLVLAANPFGRWTPACDCRSWASGSWATSSRFRQALAPRPGSSSP